MPASDAFEVLSYSIENLISIISKRCNVHSSLVDEKDHLSFFEEYFSESDAVSILVENHYVDHDFLDDYAAYYAKCFRTYGRFCWRLHFFRLEFSAADFSDLLAGGKQTWLTVQALQECYLGFIVLKPLPETFIGRTCLVTYAPDGQRRHFPTTRPYEAHLFGIPLTVKSVAFQEQDHIVAACATSALWSVFQSTGKLFHHPIPSPVEITRAATFSNDVTRSLPNAGLNLEQMATAIRMTSLEPYVVDVHKPRHLKATAYAYLRGHIPLLLSVDLCDTHLVNSDAVTDASDDPDNSGDPSGECSDDSEIETPNDALPAGPASPNDLTPSDQTVEENDDDAFRIPRGTKMDSHAVALVGYSLGKEEPIAFDSTGLLLKAMRIDKLYAHDDGIGPFARMEFDDEGFLKTTWRGDMSGVRGAVIAAPDNVLIPLYNKIRIPLDVVISAIGPFDELVEELRNDGTLTHAARLEWDVFLTSGVELKEGIFKSTNLESTYQRDLLLSEMPRFLWCADASCDGQSIVRFLFDATDIEQGQFFLSAIEFDQDLAAAMRELSAGLIDQFRALRTGRILEWYYDRREAFPDESAT